MSDLIYELFDYDLCVRISVNASPTIKNKYYIAPFGLDSGALLSRGRGDTMLVRTTLLAAKRCANTMMAALWKKAYA